MLNNRKPLLNDFNKHGKALAEKTGSPDVPDKLAAVNQKYDTLTAQLQEREDLLEKIAENLEANDKNLTKVEEDLPVITQQVLELAPVSVEPEEVETQLQEVKEIQTQLAEDKQCVESAQDAVEWIFVYAKPEPDVETEMKERINKVQCTTVCAAKRFRTKSFSYLI